MRHGTERQPPRLARRSWPNEAVSWTLPDDFPSVPESLKEVLDRAERLGTLGRIDRTPQYQAPEYATNEALHTSINELANTVRKLERKQDRDLTKIWALRFMVGAEAALIGWLASELLSRIAK